MRRGTPEYVAAQAAMAKVLLERARSRNWRIEYGELSRILARDGHHVPPHSWEMDHLLADVSHQESPDGSKVMLSVMVVLKADGQPGAGFYRLAREEFDREGDDLTVWIQELERLERDYGQR